MKKALCLVAAAALGFGFAQPLQTRAKKEEPKFEQLQTTLTKHWESQSYGSCATTLKRMQELVSKQRRKAILAALPAPTGWTIKEDDSFEKAQGNPFAAQLMASVGNMIKREYKADEGKGRLDVTVTADSPLVSMIGMQFTNPAMLDKDSELIEYNDNKAILRARSGNPSELMILIDGKHICEIKVRGTSEEQLFGIFDQAAVDKLAAALAK